MDREALEAALRLLGADIEIGESLMVTRLPGGQGMQIARLRLHSMTTSLSHRESVLKFEGTLLQEAKEGSGG